MTGCSTTAVAVNTKSAITTIRATPEIDGGLAGPMRHQHEERDAGAGAEQHGGADHVKEFQDEIGSSVFPDGDQHQVEHHDRGDLEQGPERIGQSCGTSTVPTTRIGDRDDQGGQEPERDGCAGTRSRRRSRCRQARPQRSPGTASVRLRPPCMTRPTPCSKPGPSETNPVAIQNSANTAMAGALSR